jgi:hypothetical protein
VGDSELLFGQSLSDLCERVSTPNAEDAAGQRFERFIEATGCEIVPAGKMDTDRLLQMYFAPSPPFEIAKNKKNEFPDAIALITLEDWARQNNKKLLAITKDKGWLDFASNSEWIFTEQDLAAGLEMLQDDAEVARGIVVNFLTRMAKDEDIPASERLQQNITRCVEDLMPIAEGNSAFHMDTPIANVEFKSFDVDLDERGIVIVESSKDAIIARVPIDVEARATATFEFQVKDEREYIPIGSGTGDITWKFEAGAVLTIIGEYTSTPPELELDDVEMVDTPVSVYFGDVELDIDFDDHYDGYDGQK